MQHALVLICVSRFGLNSHISLKNRCLGPGLRTRMALNMHHITIVSHRAELCSFDGSNSDSRMQPVCFSICAEWFAVSQCITIYKSTTRLQSQRLHTDGCQGSWQEQASRHTTTTQNVVQILETQINEHGHVTVTGNHAKEIEEN